MMNRIGSTQDAAAGAFLLALSGIALWGSADLAAGSLRHIGPGLLPRSLAILTGALGVVLLGGAFFNAGQKLERLQWRGPLFVLGAAMAFALAIRPLGLIVAVPVAMLIAAFASDESKWIEALVFALVMTLGCYLLFKVLLGLPIPVAPWLIDY
ncbi:MAG: tripartite tricarboxylate transporter TctB family protein [Burkholderiales bacterium]